MTYRSKIIDISGASFCNKISFLFATLKIDHYLSQSIIEVYHLKINVQTTGGQVRDRTCEVKQKKVVENHNS